MMFVLVTKKGVRPVQAPLAEAKPWEDVFRDDQDARKKMPVIEPICLSDNLTNSALEKWNATNPRPVVLYEFSKDAGEHGFASEYVSFRQVAYRAEKSNAPLIPLIYDPFLAAGQNNPRIAGVLRDIANRSAVVLPHLSHTAALADSVRQCEGLRIGPQRHELQISDMSRHLLEIMWTDVHAGGKDPFSYGKGVPKKAFTKFTYNPVGAKETDIVPDDRREKIEYAVRYERGIFIVTPKRPEQIGVLSLVYAMRRAYYEEDKPQTSLELVLS